MAYAARQDLNEAFGVEMIDRLAARPDDLGGDQAVARALSYADSIIDAALSVRFTLPVETSPVLTAIAVDLAVARLAGADALTLTDDIKHREKTARADLKDIASGALSLGLTAQRPGRSPRPVVNGSGGKLFTRDSLRRF